MSKITKVYPLPAKPPQYPEAKVLVYIDGEKCSPIRERTWRAMGLQVGSEITREELIEREKFHWKNEYKKAGGWEKEKVRLAAVKAYIENIDRRIEAKITGFGANSTEFIAEHPDEQGRPDIEVVLRHNQLVVLLVEVSGTERMRGYTYWIRPDKIAYAINHPNEDVWIILHYAEPQQKFVFFKPQQGVNYPVITVDIRGSGERMAEIDDRSPGVVTEAGFRNHLLQRMA
ncbi:MAG: hypothetical protein E6R04_11225 [Spirochaetes bacterium]|nr:MAG: hypothetical protein E6R04_11225 [Spirochaetota bacterium]